MTTGPSHRLPARGSLLRIARTAGLESLPIAMGAASLLGWAFGAEQLEAGFPGDSPMKVNTAVLMLVTGLGLWLVRRHPERSPARTTGIALGAAALTLALAILVEHATGRSLGIDELLFDDPSSATPGLPGVSTAAAFALGGAGVVLLDVRLRRFRPAQVPAIGMIVISVGPLAGYLYEAPVLTHRGSIYGMALHSAMGVALLGAALLAARPRAGMLALPSGEGAGSVLARRLLVPAVLLPLALGYVQLEGQEHGWWDADTGVSLMVIGMILVFGGLVWHAAAGVQRADADLRAANEARRQLLARLVSAQEEERLRIAQDIHDDSIQVMTALALQLDRGTATTTEPESQALFAGAADIGRTALERLRRLTFDLHPPTLDEFGLRTAIEQHLATTAAGLQTTVTDTSEIEPDPQIRTVAYRIVQEAIQNVYKHAGASRIDVAVSRVADRLRVVVADDGRGFDPGGASRGRPGHLGLISMRERAEMADGSLTIRSQPGTGTTIELLVPLSADCLPLS